MRKLYEHLRFEEALLDFVLKEHPDNLEGIAHCRDRIIKQKRRIRKWLKEKYDNHYNGYENGFVVGGHWEFDGGWRKVFFPGEHWADEDKKEFTEENWKRCRYSAYDCTGDIFTWAIDCFNVPSGVVCYMREAVDV